jgi:hypothetical protein
MRRPLGRCSDWPRFRRGVCLTVVIDCLGNRWPKPVAGISDASLTAEPCLGATLGGAHCLSMVMRPTQWCESDAKVMLVIVGAFALGMLLLAGGAYLL